MLRMGEEWKIGNGINLLSVFADFHRFHWFFHRSPNNEVPALMIHVISFFRFEVPDQYQYDVN
jgi:hypothetical protein